MTFSCWWYLVVLPGWPSQFVSDFLSMNSQTLWLLITGAMVGCLAGRIYGINPKPLNLSPIFTDFVSNSSNSKHIFFPTPTDYPSSQPNYIYTHTYVTTPNSKPNSFVWYLQVFTSPKLRQAAWGLSWPAAACWQKIIWLFSATMNSWGPCLDRRKVFRVASLRHGRGWCKTIFSWKQMLVLDQRGQLPSFKKGQLQWLRLAALLHQGKF